MKHLLFGLAAVGLAIPASFAAPPDGAWAKRHDRQHREYRHREWRGKDGRTYCRKSDGTTGLIVGGVGGALLGRTIDTRGDRTLGTLGGAAVGALIGKEVDSKRTCR